MPEDQVKIKKESSHSAGMTCCSDESYYPYGLSLNIDDDLVDELDAGNLAVGDVVEVRGYAFVDSKSEHSNTEGGKTVTNKSIRLQMTSMKVDRQNDDRVKQLYGGDS
jgi:hypothetical protein